MELDVLTLGETLVSFEPTEVGRIEAAATFRKRFGGAESNTAIGLARLGCRVAWVSRVSTDPFGDEILKVLGGEGVDVGHVVRADDDAPTGLMVKELRAPEEVHVHYWRSGSAATGLGPGDIDEGLVASARRVHLTGITLALGDGPRAAVDKVVRAAADHGVPISFDPNLREKLWSLDEAMAAYEKVLPFASDLLIGESEALRCTGATSLDAAIDRFHGYGIPTVVVKRAALGALASSGGTVIEQPADPDVVAVDSVGAGDGFDAGYLYGRLNGDDLAGALATGVWVGGKVVGHPGDYQGLPTLAELEDLRASKGVVTR
jgi:2-dehydro-3-deoxygluconokinase